MIRLGTRVRVVLAVLGCLAAVSCGSGQVDVVGPAPAPNSTSPVPVGVLGESGSVTGTPEAEQCPYPKSGFDCDFQRRFAAVQAYIATRPGTVGIVVRDRATGAVWRNQYADTLVWTASTIKLAMTIDLFRRDAAGTITLSASDRSLIQRMLHSSDDNAADALWGKYSGPGHLTYNDDFPAYGMTSLVPERGYTSYFPYWGFQKCTPDDLDRLVNYLLDTVPATTRDYIVDQLSNVDPDQQWGVWGAGPAALPGNKDGWSLEDTGWVMNTVGWVGPGQRYTLAVMNSLNKQGVYADGQATDNEVAKLLFAGRAL